MSHMRRIVRNLVHPDEGNLSPPLCEHFLKQKVTPEEDQRYIDLLSGSQQDTLTSEERSECHALQFARTFVEFMHEKARKSLEQAMSPQQPSGTSGASHL